MRTLDDECNGPYCRRRHGAQNSLSAIRQIDSEIDDAANAIATNSAPTLPNNIDFHMREARYSDLGQVADLTTDAFFFSSTNTGVNPITRTIRYLLELDRLQNNFPYNAPSINNNENDDRHFYLVATPADDDSKIIGFCDIDGRTPKAKEKDGLGMLGVGLPAKKKPTMATVQRPCPYFSDLVVHPSYRRRGIASNLASEAECRANKNWKYDELYLCIRLDDELVLRMYSDRGYVFVDPSNMSQDMMDFLAVQEGKTLMRLSFG